MNSRDQCNVLNEQKDLGLDLQRKIRQSGGSLFTPFQQAALYSAELQDVRARRAHEGRLSRSLRTSFTTTSPDQIPRLNKKQKIGETAKSILDARALYSDASLADLYVWMN